jgi:hypothetical protein
MRLLVVGRGVASPPLALAAAAVSLVLAALVLTALVLAPPAAAHFDAGAGYTHDECPATVRNRIDPVNVVFYGWATWGRAVSQIESHAAWTATSGSGQSFVDHDACHPMHAQRASGSGSRFHLRLRGQHPDALLGWTTTADAHHEDFVAFPIPCGHAVDSNGAGGSGFDQGRDAVRDRFAAAGHSWYRVWWGNTQSFKQCDGDYAASDGWTVFVQLHQVNH